MLHDEEFQSFLYWLGFDKLILLLVLIFLVAVVTMIVMIPSRYKKKRMQSSSIQRMTMMNEKITPESQQPPFDPLVQVRFKLPFSTREKLKKQAFTQGISFDKFMEDLINKIVTTTE